ncbi:MAG: ABC transporter substrate-binding protein [Alphaproteobacteria bacterium]|nr:ABC transporter substrate-binding protein [Alphaproteobacteria bacterium]
MEYYIMVFGKIIKSVNAFALALTLNFSALAEITSPTYKIGVLQIIEHPALDKTCQGIRDELTSQGFKETLQWSWDSAQGNPALATQIAQKYVGNQVDLIVAIGTTAAQAALNASNKGQVQVVFASVTDPKGANLVGNVTGVSNFIPTKDQLEILIKIIPDKKRLGVVYNAGEANSVSLLEKMQECAKQMGLEIIPATASKTSEVASAAQGLIGKVDAIFINNDNTALAAIKSIGKICGENHIPLFASDGDLKESGSLALLGADQYEIGRQTGRLVAKILRGESQAKDMEVEYPKQVAVDLNDKVAQDLNIQFPDSIRIKKETKL